MEILCGKGTVVGGAFERLVKSTKSCLRKMIRHSKVTLDQLQTLLVEVESIINSRPLTCVSEKFGRATYPVAFTDGQGGVKFTRQSQTGK